MAKILKFEVELDLTSNSIAVSVDGGPPSVKEFVPTSAAALLPSNTLAWLAYIALYAPMVKVCEEGIEDVKRMLAERRRARQPTPPPAPAKAKEKPKTKGKK
jgi:hypothetical protein